MRAFLISIFLLFASFGAVAQAAEPVGRASLVSEYDAIDAQGEGAGFWLALEIRMPEDWHIYWRNPGDSGIPPQVKLTLPEGFSHGPLHWPAPEVVEYDFLTNYGYSDPSYVMIPVIPPKEFSADEYTFSGKAEWLICKETCIPESADISLTLPVSDTPKLTEREELHEQIAGLPKPFDGEAQFQETETHFTLTLTGAANASIDEAQLFLHESGVASHALADQSWEVEGDALRLSIAKGGIEPTQLFSGNVLIEYEDDREVYYHVGHREGMAEAVSLDGVHEAQKDVTEPTATPATASKSGMGIFAALLFAFAGGLVLNLMPCVLPVLSLKALSLAKLQDKDKGEIRKQALAYTAGIVLSFLLIAGALIVLKYAGQSVGWGFQLQEPAFVLVLLYVVFAVGLNLSGVFEFTSAFSNAGGELTQGNSAKSSFFTGVLAVLVATPCTAPFMAGALGYAVTQPAPVMLAIFIALGLGLAAPYLLVSFVPVFRHILPKPGVWMEGFKQFLAFPMYATAAWLLWVLTIQAGEMGMLWALAGLIAIAYLAWALNRGFGKVAKVITIVLMVSVIGQSVYEQKTVNVSAAVIEHKSDVPHVAFSEEKLAQLRAQGTPVFVDATAAWCITCKVNERSSINIESTQKAFAQKGITVMIADWTNRDESIRKYLERYGRNGVPLYVYYAPGEEGEVLPQILTPEIVLDAIDADD